MHNDSLPKEWLKVQLSEVTNKVLKVNPKETPKDEFIYIDISSINEDYQIDSPKMYNGKDAPSRARQKIRTGDILFSTVRTYLKHIAIVPNDYDNQIASTGFCVIRPREFMNNKFIFYLTLTEFFINALTVIQRGTSYPAVRNSDVLSQPIPIPSIDEQFEIINHLELNFSIIENIMNTIKESLTYANNLRQSILKYAFEGKLVYQDPNDEPAKNILDKIKQEKLTNKKNVEIFKKRTNDSKQMRLS